jgi:hypothetical protein
MPFIAGDDDDTCSRYIVEIPGDFYSVMAFSGALAELAKVHNWEVTGTWTAEGLAGVFRDALNSAVWAGCEGEAEEIMSIAILSEVYAQNVAAGTLTLGDWRTRLLNTELDPDGIVSLASAQFTLPSGTFFVFAQVPGYQVSSFQARLYDVSAEAVIALGSSMGVSGTAYTRNDKSFICAFFTLAASHALEIQQRSILTKATNGMGQPANIANEVYAQVVIIQVA